jgi:hypothetical protein
LGRELIDRWFMADVQLACEYGVRRAVPVLQGERFVNGGHGSRDADTGSIFVARRAGRQQAAATAVSSNETTM